MSSIQPMLPLPPRLDRARMDRLVGHLTLRRVFVENGLSIVVLGLFVVCLAIQIMTGLRAHNQERWQEGEAGVTLGQYLTSGHFLEATAENWESEFLQMAAFVWLTSFLFQKGSPESKDPYEEDDVAPVTEKSPWPARRGGWVLWIYERSLTFAFLLLFIVSFILHAAGGAMEHNEQAPRLGEPMLSWWQYIGTSKFWFESMQNWQSEFLSIAAMVILAIFLRHKGSAESKPVPAPHSANE
jgi:hypothetical protein